MLALALKASGALILYTSQDSVLQLAAHVDRVPPQELYRACATAREQLTGEHAVGLRPADVDAQDGFAPSCSGTHLTAPAVRPPTRCFSISANSTTTGTIATRLAANSWSQCCS